MSMQVISNSYYNEFNSLGIQKNVIEPKNINLTIAHCFVNNSSYYVLKNNINESLMQDILQRYQTFLIGPKKTENYKRTLFSVCNMRNKVKKYNGNIQNIKCFMALTFQHVFLKGIRFITFVAGIAAFDCRFKHNNRINYQPILNYVYLF